VGQTSEMMTRDQRDKGSYGCCLLCRPKVKSFQDLHSLDASDGLVGVLPRPPSPVPSSLPVLAELETPFGSPGPDALSMADIFSRLNATKATDDVSQAPDQTSAPTRASESTEPPTAPASALTAAPTLPEPLPEALAAAEAVPGFQLRVETTFTPIEKSFSDPSAATAPLTPPTALAFKPAQSLPVPQAPPKVAPATPAPTEVRIFRTHLQLNYIQEVRFFQICCALFRSLCACDYSSPRAGQTLLPAATEYNPLVDLASCVFASRVFFSWLMECSLVFASCRCCPPWPMHSSWLLTQSPRPVQDCLLQQLPVHLWQQVQLPCWGVALLAQQPVPVHQLVVQQPQVLLMLQMHHLASSCTPLPCSRFASTAGQR
jgi:hypothetical protein